MTRSNVIQFAPALQRRQTRQSNPVWFPAHSGPWDRRYVTGIDGMWAEPPAMGMVIPFRVL